jgi:hypothetical protein
MSQQSIQVTLTRDEALVLFEWLASLDEKQTFHLEEAEQKVVWRIEGQLESLLTEVLAPDYREQLRIAKRNVLNGS